MDIPTAKKPRIDAAVLPVLSEPSKVESSIVKDAGFSNPDGICIPPRNDSHISAMDLEEGETLDEKMAVNLARSGPLTVSVNSSPIPLVSTPFIETRTYKGCSPLENYQLNKKVGEGTFGFHFLTGSEVNIMTHVKTGQVYALKKILMHNEKEGIPITALREIKILKSIKHENIIELTEIAIKKGNRQLRQRGEIHMVFPFMDHDLNGLLENPNVRFSPSQIKSYIFQLLKGTAYLHDNSILHRDMKTANILISADGTLKLADFGLARAFMKSAVDPKYTNMVVTRWYRPPELILGTHVYGPEIDMWGVGCVIGEILKRRPLLVGNDDFDQLDKIFELCGTATIQNWPGLSELPLIKSGEISSTFLVIHERSIVNAFKQFFQHNFSFEKDINFVGAIKLIDEILICDPKRRLTAEQALRHTYFFTSPKMAQPKTKDFEDKWESSHELGSRLRRSAAAANKTEDLIPGMKSSSSIQLPPHYTTTNTNSHNNNSYHNESRNSFGVQQRNSSNFRQGGNRDGNWKDNRNNGGGGRYSRGYK